MIKLISPMKRRPGISIEEFREYYEKKHRVIGEKYLTGFATKYMRRFTNSLPDHSGKVKSGTQIWKPIMHALRNLENQISHKRLGKTKLSFLI